MPALQVNPTRMELMRLKKRLITSKRGHKLLKDKRDEMVRQFIQLIQKNRALRFQVEKELSQALREFSFANAVMDSEMVECAIAYPARSARLSISQKNVMNVKVPVIRVREGELSETMITYGFAETSAQLDSAIAAIAEVLPLMVELAEIESTCNLLADEIEKTRRRVNALEYVMIPRTEETIRYITMKLEEDARGSLTRLMKVKEMIAEREEETVSIQQS